jgi:hypothetical protein
MEDREEEGRGDLHDIVGPGAAEAGAAEAGPILLVQEQLRQGQLRLEQLRLGLLCSNCRSAYRMLPLLHAFPRHTPL